MKIGHSEDVDRRREQLESHYGRPLVLLKTLPGDREEERALHERFAEHRIGRTEQFRPAPDLMEFIGRPLLIGPNPDVVEVMPTSGLEPLRVDVPRELKDAIEEYVTEIGSTKTVYIRMLIIADLKAKGKLP